MQYIVGPTINKTQCQHPILGGCGINICLVDGCGIDLCFIQGCGVDNCGADGCGSQCSGQGGCTAYGCGPVYACMPAVA